MDENRDEHAPILYNQMQDRLQLGDLLMSMDYQLKRQNRIIDIQRANGKAIDDVLDEVNSLRHTTMHTKQSIEEQQARLEKQQLRIWHVLAAIDQKLSTILNTVTTNPTQ